MTNSRECPQWHSSIFSRYINNEATPADLATLHNHFNQCNLCHQRFLAPLKEAMALASQDTVVNEDAPAEKASWQIFKKDLIAVAQQAKAKQVSFDLAYHQLKEAESLYSQNIDYLASLANEDISQWPELTQSSPNNLVEFSPLKPAASRKQFLANLFKVAAIIVLALAPVALVLKADLLKIGTSTTTVQLKITPNRYEQIDQQLDRYLQARLTNNTSEAENALEEASNLAQGMSNQTKDLYGQDLVGYYRNLASENLAKAIKARQLVKEAQAFSSRNQVTKVAAKAQEAQAIFESLGADTELESINFMLAKYLPRIGKLSEAQALVDRCLDKAKGRQHLLSYAQFLYNKSDILGEKGQYAQEISLLNESIEIATPLEVPDLLVYIQANLAKIYFVTNDDQQAFTQATQTLATYKEIPNYRLLLDLNQIAGLSSYNLKATSQSQTYLTDSITLAKQHQDWAYLVQGYWMLGLVKAQELDFNEADKLFNLAFENIPKLDDPNSELYMESIVTGYYARKQALAKNYQESVELYAKSIKLSEKSNSEQKAMLSQLHQGLAEGLVALGNHAKANEHLAIARYLKQESQNLEQNNNLLTFAPTNRNINELFKNTP